MGSLNLKEFDVAQKAMDILEMERRKSPSQEGDFSMDKEKVHDFIVKSLNEQGIEVTEERVSSALEQVFGSSSQSLPAIEIKEKSVEVNHLIFNGPLSVEEAVKVEELFLNHVITDEKTLNTTVINFFKNKELFYNRLFLILCFIVFLFFTVSFIINPLLSSKALFLLNFLTGFVGFLSLNISFIFRIKNKKLYQKYSGFLNREGCENLMKIFFKISYAYKDSTYEKNSYIHDSLFGAKSRSSCYIDLEYPKTKRIVEAYQNHKVLNKIWMKWLSYGKPISKYEFFLLYEALGRKVYMACELRDLALMKIELEQKMKVKKEYLLSKLIENNKDFDYLLYKRKMYCNKYSKKYQKKLGNPFNDNEDCDDECYR